MQSKNTLFTEKYRPSSLNDLILPDHLMKKFENGLVHNTLLAGSPGTGKTSMAKALVSQFNHPYLYINASKDTSVDVIRERITDFCSTYSVMDTNNSLKVVILDEFDGFSDQAFKALRATMEEYSSNSRFICTCNFINKIPDPILSRFDVINFDFDKADENELIKKYLIKIHGICKLEGLQMASNQVLLEFVKLNFPDMRSVLNKLQSFKIQGLDVITSDDINKFSSVYSNVFDLVFNESDSVKNYQTIVGEYQNKVDDVLKSMGSDLIEYIKTNHTQHIKHIPQIIITVAKYQHQRITVIDPVISLLACVYEIQTILKA